MALQRQRRFKVLVAGVDRGVWDTSSGAEFDSAEKKYYPGGMDKPISEGGKVIIPNATLTAYFDPSLHIGPMKQLSKLVGKGAKAAFEGIEQFLDVDGNVVGEGLTWIGTLKRVKWPDSDSESDDEAMRELEATITDIR